MLWNRCLPIAINIEGERHSVLAGISWRPFHRVVQPAWEYDKVAGPRCVVMPVASEWREGVWHGAASDALHRRVAIFRAKLVVPRSTRILEHQPAIPRLNFRIVDDGNPRGKVNVLQMVAVVAVNRKPRLWHCAVIGIVRQQL